ncbi:hypothetical protein B0H17DRAFT_1147661 [Mycena rosella]|uniref:Uncharacterized protein n=1 Tax=Mycena rosella TaxID=1033263 RepID=A0AAD7CL33_MYCRO|nr:hypothetical protein B0H17DRAFT_1147661 [Mycena rosella]
MAGRTTLLECNGLLCNGLVPGGDAEQTGIGRRVQPDANTERVRPGISTGRGPKRATHATPWRDHPSGDAARAGSKIDGSESAARVLVITSSDTWRLIGGATCRLDSGHVRVVCKGGAEQGKFSFNSKGRRGQEGESGCGTWAVSAVGRGRRRGGERERRARSWEVVSAVSIFAGANGPGSAELILMGPAFPSTRRVGARVEVAIQFALACAGLPPKITSNVVRPPVARALRRVFPPAVIGVLPTVVLGENSQQDQMMDRLRGSTLVILGLEVGRLIFAISFGSIRLTALTRKVELRMIDGRAARRAAPRGGPEQAPDRRAAARGDAGRLRASAPSPASAAWCPAALPQTPSARSSRVLDALPSSHLIRAQAPSARLAIRPLQVRRPGLVQVNVCTESLKIVDVKIQISPIGRQAFSSVFFFSFLLLFSLRLSSRCLPLPLPPLPTPPPASPLPPLPSRPRFLFPAYPRFLRVFVGQVPSKPRICPQRAHLRGQRATGRGVACRGNTSRGLLYARSRLGSRLRVCVYDALRGRRVRAGPTARCASVRDSGVRGCPSVRGLCPVKLVTSYLLARSGGAPSSRRRARAIPVCRLGELRARTLFVAAPQLSFLSSSYLRPFSLLFFVSSSHPVLRGAGPGVALLSSGGHARAVAGGALGAALARRLGGVRACSVRGGAPSSRGRAHVPLRRSDLLERSGAARAFEARGCGDRARSVLSGEAAGPNCVRAARARLRVGLWACRVGDARGLVVWCARDVYPPAASGARARSPSRRRSSLFLSSFDLRGLLPRHPPPSYSSLSPPGAGQWRVGAWSGAHNAAVWGPAASGCGSARGATGCGAVSVVLRLRCSARRRCLGVASGTGSATGSSVRGAAPSSRGHAPTALVPWAAGESGTCAGSLDRGPTLGGLRAGRVPGCRVGRGRTLSVAAPQLSFLRFAVLPLVAASHHLSLPPRPVLPTNPAPSTRDTVNVEIDSVIYFQICSPYRSAFGITRQALIERTQTTLRDVVGARGAERGDRTGSDCV